MERRSRGPHHHRPVLLRFTALLHVLTRLLFVISVLGVPLGMMYFHESLPYLLVFPVLLLLTGPVWLVAASKIGCRVCAMRMFYNKNCAKSRKAPNWPLLGPHNTLALLSLFSKAVRCPYCGTPNDLMPPDKRGS